MILPLLLALAPSVAPVQDCGSSCGSKAKAAVAAQRAMSIGKSVLSGRAQGFVYPVSETEDSES